MNALTQGTEKRDSLKDIERAQAGSDRLWKNNALLLSGLVVFASIAKTIAVARGNLTTAIVLISEANPVDIGLRSATLVLPFTLGAAAIQLVNAAHELRKGVSAPERERIRFALVIVSMAAILVVDYLIVAGVVSLLFFSNYAIPQGGRLWARIRKRAQSEPALPLTDAQLFDKEPSDRVLNKLREEFMKISAPDDIDKSGDLSLMVNRTARMSEIRQEFEERQDRISTARYGGYDRALSSALIPILAVQLLMQVASDSSWIAAEKIFVERHRQPVIGYVIGTSDGWTTVLTEQTRTIVRYRDQTVVRRVTCAVEGHSRTRVVFKYLYGGSDAKYTKCE